MKAAWDWHLPRTTATEQHALVAFTHGLGFDTLIVHDPTPVIMEQARERGITVCAILTPNVTDDILRQYPECCQRLLPAEEAILAATNNLDWEEYTALAHHWFPLIQPAQLFCFEDPVAQTELKGRVSQALAVADGVAFDGFGFRNHYACFCPHCDGMRRELMAANPQLHEADVTAQMSEASLVRVSELLYAHAKAVKPTALLTNHVWPPFRPNPYYAWRLKLDYCSQTLSWFYKPHWSLTRMEFEAQEMKRLEDRTHNRFVPFIGMFHHPHLVRTAERLAAELAVAQQYGEGSLIFCNLSVLQEQPRLQEIVRVALADAS
jgi:hypothetical protein